MLLPILLGAGGVIFAFLLKTMAGGRRGRGAARHRRATEIAIAGLAAIAVTGALGLCWFAASMLYHDGVMIVELLICASLIVLLAAIVAGGFALRHHGMAKAAVALLAVAAVPTIAVCGFLLYLDNHPIDMR